MAGFFDGVPEPEPSLLPGFAGNRFDRRSEHRGPDSVPAALADPAARLYLFDGDRVFMRSAQPSHTLPEALALGAEIENAVLLGWSGSAPRLAATAPEPATGTDGVTLVDLRALATTGAVSPEHLGALAQARSLLHWHDRHGFCSNCGSPTAVTNGGYRRDCPACGAEHFPRTDPVVIMLAILGDGADARVLLGRQRRFPSGMFSALAGFLEPGETVEAAARRETLEESGIHVGRVRYYASQPWPFPASLMIGCHAEALSETIQRDDTELEDCRWFGRAEIAAMLIGAHPAGFKAPHPIAIAHWLVRAWSERPAT
jgi:NAD+ diphosphatase